jgi:hypothetical protein
LIGRGEFDPQGKISLEAALVGWIFVETKDRSLGQTPE